MSRPAAASLAPAWVTGVGSVCNVGCGREDLARALERGEGVWTEVDRSGGFHQPGSGRLAGLTTDLDLSRWLPAGSARRMSRLSRLAVAATQMAADDAGLSEAASRGSRSAVFVSNPFGPCSVLESILGQIETNGPTAVSPASFTESVANAPASQIAIRFGVTGPNYTVTQSDAGSLIALKRGATVIARGLADVVFVVVVDEVTPLLHALLDRFRALSRPADEAGECARPFDRRRHGYMAGEGATAIVLESRDSVDRRGGRPLAEVTAAFNGFEPKAPRNSWAESPLGLAARARSGLRRAGVRVEAIDCVVSGACGSRLGDRLEAGVIREVWRGQSVPMLLAPRSVIGSHAGAVVSVALLALIGCACGPTAGFEEADPALGIEPHNGKAARRPERVFLSSLSPGGSAAWAVLEAVR